ncbi:hypothetical protein HAX54_007949, partial [Datura stramonium]|nr:hypothetical protein [Datura stramonium]
MKYDFEKSKDETRYDMKFHKPVIEVFKSSGPSAKIAEATTDLVEATTRTESVSHAAKLPTSTPSTSVATTTQKGAESVETSFMVHPPSWYAFTPVNFAKVAQKADRREKQLKLFVVQLGTFVDRAIKVDLESYKNLHARLDDMEARVNEKLKDLTMVEGHATDATVSSESETLITPPPSTEVGSPDTFSVPSTTTATTEVLGLNGQGTTSLIGHHIYYRAKPSETLQVTTTLTGRRPCDGPSTLASILLNGTARSGITDDQSDGPSTYPWAVNHGVINNAKEEAKMHVGKNQEWTRQRAVGK